jgi:alkanesulfonate monooxygenase SsuD/methylene tetrahydromethanopterin reductase-like flavin-dependent oxidoreductase (luciferase family)
MRFGIFDHLDDSGRPLGTHFEERLKLIEAYDRAGFYGYHLAEHHNTPLGYAPSPGLFLSAVAQRTKELRFGPMVYLLPLYHPLRLIDEVCMLDQMSGGRFLYGVGRGISPIEVGFYGVNFDTGAEQFREAYEVIQIGLTENELTYHGKYYDFDHVPIVMKPVQKPAPECGTAPAAGQHPWAAERARLSLATLGGTRDHRAVQDGMAAARPLRGRSAEDGHQPPHRRRRHRGKGARHRAARLQAVAPAHGAFVG